MDINYYLAQQFSPQPCWELVSLVYERELHAVPVNYHATRCTVRQMAGAFRIAIHEAGHGFVQIAEPVDLCMVMLGRHAHIGVHHCGVYFDGKVLHAQPGITLYEDMSVIRDTFAIVEFWAKPTEQGA